MAYFSDNLQRSAGNGVILRDYQHASKIFRPGSFDLAPKLKFLFHTYFDINPVAYAGGINDGQNFGVLVKSVKLPSFSIKTQELNQYNRKRIVQTKISYESSSVTFHDDSINTITKLWDAYYSYYYKDPTNFNGLFSGRASQIGNSDPGNLQLTQDYNVRNIYDGDLTGENNWGYIGESFRSNSATKAPFFRNITIFGFSRHNFTAYTLINPMITKLDHDTYNYNEAGGTMDIKMDINYETVVYNEGAIDGQDPSSIVAGFGLEQYYDRELSPLTPPGTNSAITGRGTYKNASGGVVNPLNRLLSQGS